MIPDKQPDNSVAIHYVRQALLGARRQGMDINRILRQADIPVALLGEEKARVSTQQFMALLVALVKMTDDEMLLHGGRPTSRPGTFNLMCHSIISMPNLQKALIRAGQFYHVIAPSIQLRIVRRGETAGLRLVPHPEHDDPAHFNTECLLTIIHRLASWLIDQRIDLLEARFAYAEPAHAAEYHQLFHCPLTFGQPHTELVFESRVLRQPIMQTPATLKRFLGQAPYNLQLIPNNDRSLTAQVQKLIGKNFAEEFPDFESIASLLAMTPQTLRRRLKNEGTSYQEIKDALRRDTAIYYLARPEFSIADITTLMGFSEPSTFHRAFKKWTGLTPGNYREEQLDIK